MIRAADPKMRTLRVQSATGLTATRQPGLEPGTYGLEGRCSIQLSYWRGCNRKIGTARFELATPRSQSECSTGLSHVPQTDVKARVGKAACQPEGPPFQRV